MKVWQFLEIQSVIDKRSIPSDLADDKTEYYSESDQCKIKLLNMEVIHLIRAFKKQINLSKIDNDKMKAFFDLAYEITNERRKQ